MKSGLCGHFFLLLGGNNTLFLECSYCLGAKFHSDFFAINYKSLCLEIRLPNLLGVALREAHIVAKLLAFTG